MRLSEGGMPQARAQPGQGPCGGGEQAQGARRLAGDGVWRVQGARGLKLHSTCPKPELELKLRNGSSEWEEAESPRAALLLYQNECAQHPARLRSSTSVPRSPLLEEGKDLREPISKSKAPW